MEKVSLVQVIRCVAFSSDGNMIISGSDDKTLRLWDVHTGEHIHTLSGYTDFIKTVAFSPDGNMIASSGWDGTVLLWELGK